MLEPASSVCFDPTQAFGNLSLSRTKRIGVQGRNREFFTLAY
jgi:hypothetical protein